MIHGKYNYGINVLIDTNLDSNNIDTKVHEITHQTITQCSLYGVLLILLKAMNEELALGLKDTFKVLADACITTEEMSALYGQCLIKRVAEPENFANYYKELKSTEQYHMYCMAGFEEILNYPQYQINDTILLTEIAIFAMDFDLTELDPDWTDPSEVQRIIASHANTHNADYRYRKLIKTVRKLIRNNEEITEEKLLRLSRVTYQDREYDAVAEMLNRFARQLSKRMNLPEGIFKQYIENVKAPKETFFQHKTAADVEQPFVPFALNGNYRWPENADANFNLQMDSVFFALPDSNMMIVHKDDPDKKLHYLAIFHHATAGYYYYIPMVKKEAETFISRFEGNVIFFTEDYDRVDRMVKLPKERRIFYCYVGEWRYFMETIRCKSIPKVFIHEVDEDKIAIFVINEKNEVFFTLQYNTIYKYILDEIKKGNMEYVQKFQPDFTDGIFYLESNDWCRYEDVIMAYLQKTYLNFTNDGKVLGRRVVIEDIAE